MNFLEIASSCNKSAVEHSIKEGKKYLKSVKNLKDAYPKLHNTLFPSSYEEIIQRKTLTSSDKEVIQEIVIPYGGIGMSLDNDSGVFIDEIRIASPLSRIYCCPSYLSHLEDQLLKKDIYHALSCDLDKIPDYDKHSFNFGYAHQISMKKKFIDCTVTHEKEKNVVIVLNQKGAYGELSEDAFFKEVFTDDLIHKLKQLGYGSISIKGIEDAPIHYIIEDTTHKRSLQIVLRPSFIPSDIRNLQLAAERQLATGDNSALEAFASKCKLYMYEALPHKSIFCEQQIAIAEKIYPPLAEFIKLSSFSNPSASDKVKINDLLQDPKITTATFRMCQKISEHTSFEAFLEGAIKRQLWQGKIPELIQEEIDAISDDWKINMMNHVMKNINTSKPFDSIGQAIKDIELLQAHIQKRVCDFLNQDI